MRDLGVAHQAALVQQHVQLVDRLERARDRTDHEVGVAARAHQRVGAQVVLLAERAASGRKLALVGRPLLARAPAPGRIHLEKGVFHVVALLGHTTSVADTAWPYDPCV